MTTAAFPTGEPLRITVSDPWEVGAGPFMGEFVHAVTSADYPDGLTILVRLSPPIQCKGATCEYFAARPRQPVSLLDEMAGGRPVECNFTHIPSDRSDVLKSLNLSGWRGGCAMIGSMRRI